MLYMLQVIMPRKHRYLSDMMAELEHTFQPPVVYYLFHNNYFFLEATPDANISTDFTIARFRRRASTFRNDEFNDLR